MLNDSGLPDDTDSGLNSFNSFNSYTPTWPEPLSDAALIGVVGDFVRTISPQTEADEAALLIQFLVAAGNCFGRHAFFRAEAERHYCNLFACLVGKSAKGRKGVSESQTRRVFKKASEELDSIADWSKHCRFSGLSSGEGLIWCVRDEITK